MLGSGATFGYVAIVFLCVQGYVVSRFFMSIGSAIRTDTVLQQPQKPLLVQGDAQSSCQDNHIDHPEMNNMRDKQEELI